MRRSALLLPLALIAGACGDRNVAPFLGKWSGGLEVLRVKGPKGGDPKARELRGDLQVYVRKFELNLTGAQQSVRVRGTWTYEDRKLRLKANDLSFDDRGGAEKRDPNRPYLAPEALQTFFGRERTLNLSKDGKRLAGVEDDLADLVAGLAFVKD